MGLGLGFHTVLVAQGLILSTGTKYLRESFSINRNIDQYHCPEINNTLISQQKYVLQHMTL